MVTFEHLEKTETISADGDESEIDGDALLKLLKVKLKRDIRFKRLRKNLYLRS